MRKRLTTLLKIAVTIVGFAIVLLNVELEKSLALLLQVRWGWALLALGMITASLALRAFRWQLLLQGLAVEIRFRRLVTLYFVGNFFNAFLPSGFGGDVVRVMEATRNVSADVAAGTVLVDRLTGLLMLFVMGLVALPFRPASFGQEMTLIVTAVSILGLAGGFILLEGSLVRRFGRWLPGPLSPVGDGPIARVLQAVQGCGWRAIGGALLVSTLFNLSLVAWWWAIGRSLSLTVPYTYYLLVVPILSIILLVPSIGGLGVRESLAPAIFAPAGLLPEEAVALSLLVFFLMRISSLFGAPVYVISLLRGRPIKTKEPTETAESVQ